jgi:hypothetical protein
LDEVAFGVPSAEPRISIVIPLYGRLDFMRYQLDTSRNHSPFC